MKKYIIFLMAALCFFLVWYGIKDYNPDIAANAGNTAGLSVSANMPEANAADMVKAHFSAADASALSSPDSNASVSHASQPVSLQLNVSRQDNSALSSTEEYKEKVEEAARRKNPIAELDSVYSEFEIKLAQALRDFRNKKLVRNNKWRRILKGNGEDAERSKQLMSEYLELVRMSNAKETIVPGQLYWDMFFDENTFDLTDEERLLLPTHDLFAERAFGYLEEVDPVWCVEAAKYARTDSKMYKGDPAGLPKHYLSLYNYSLAHGKEMMSPCSAVAYIITDFYNCRRANRFADGVLDVLQECGYVVKGKIWADVGAGTGMALPNFRDAVGPGPKMYAVDIDPYIVDLLKYTGKFAQAQALECKVDDCCLEPSSVDIITLIGVHMGAGLGEHYQCCTAPWLKSMSRALRPGGVLVISEGNLDLFDNGLIKMVEDNGFKLRKFSPPIYHDANTETKERLEAIACFDKK